MTSNPLIFILSTLLSVVCVMFAMRFLLQATRADFYNPVSQGILKFTEPVLGPIRRIVPSYKNLDIAAFLIIWLLKILAVLVLSYSHNIEPLAVNLILQLALHETLDLFLGIYFIALIILVVLSFLAPGNYHPIAVLTQQLTEPLLAPIRRILPPLGGLDFSVLVIFMLIVLLRDFLIPSILPGLQ
ncbi:MAG: YggT family protein [Pseudomonadales bacterium]|nr:YggT family protein [Pseudomonadales bacterium]